MNGIRACARGRSRVVALFLLALASTATAAAAQPTEPRVDILQVSGALDETIADYLDDALSAAARDDVEVVVIQLSTPGALGVESQRFVDLVADSPVPVAVWVGPPGARVTGAGVALALAADVLALSPASVFGGAVPSDIGEIAAPAARERVAGELAGLAEAGGRDAASFERFARDDAAVVATIDDPAALTADAALPPGIDAAAVTVLDEQGVVDAGIADVVAVGLPEVLRALDGRQVTSADGRQVALRVDPVTATIRFNNQGLFGRLLHTMSTPTLAYLLLVGGLVSLLFEWFQPGFGIAGISGVAVAALGAFGLTVLPTVWWALVLVVVGLVLLALDLAMASLGPVTAAGVVALTAGSWWLYRGPDLLRLDAWLIALVVVTAVVFFVFIMTTVLRAQGVQTRASIAAVQGHVGVVRSMLNPQGHVFVDGVLWRAQAPEGAGRVRTGTTVRVTGEADELTLLVEPVDPVASTPEAQPQQV